MMNPLYYQRKRTYIILVLVLFMLYLVTSPSWHYKVGNIFFGDVQKLYNVNIAQFFFKQATNPVIGEVPPYAHYQLSRTYFIKGELDNALHEAENEIELYPDHLHTFYIIGLTLGYMDREEEAIDAFSKFIEYKPESWAARNDRAWLQFRTGDIEGALETIEPVSHLLDNPWVQNTHGTILMNLDRPNEAREAFLHARNLANQMTEESWGKAYPGNDPRIYGAGLRAMQRSIETNMELLDVQEGIVNKLTYPPVPISYTIERSDDEF